MDYRAILNKISELKNSGLYTDEQIESIKYTCYRTDFDENLIIDPTIPGSIMLTYVKLATDKKIDISKYINEKWHLKGFNSEQLYTLIFHNSKGHDISGITPDMDVKKIRTIMKNRTDDERKNISLKSFSNLDSSQLDILSGLDRSVIELFLRHSELGYDISPLLRSDIKDFSLEQINYLFTVYSTGGNIESIYNPNLSVEQMTEIMFNSKESQEFLQMITENHNNRKR